MASRRAVLQSKRSRANDSLPTCEQINAKRTGIRRALLNWYGRHARDLPWRRTRDPYRIWLSEIMLQQTRVDTVQAYYERFTRALPRVEDLAGADEDVVLKLWEGLGYYSRARNLQRAARTIVHDLGHQFPSTAEGWQQLPGIGRYTAGAIASIAFDQRVPVLDGNVKRVFARLWAIDACIDESRTIEALWSVAEVLLPVKSPGTFNQAIMELGAQVCTPRRPQCDACPVQRWCDGHAQGRQALLPVRRSKKPTPHYEIVAAAIRKNGRYLLGKRPSDAMLGGLWEFPGGKVEAGETHEAALIRELKEELGIDIHVGRRLASVDHAYSHFSITLNVYACVHVQHRPQTHFHSALKWVPRKQFDQYAFPAANLKCFDRLREDV